MKTGKVGLAKVVIATKQHLAVLVPCGPGAGAEPAALGRRDPLLGRTWSCRPAAPRRPA